MKHAGWAVLPVLLAGAALLVARPRVQVPAPVIIAREPVRPPDPPKDVPPAVPDALKTAVVPQLLGFDGGPLATPSAIVLHSTGGLSFEAAVAEMKKRSLAVHVLIDGEGRAVQLVPFHRRARAARALDDVAIHVSVAGGVGAELLDNEKQFAACVRIVDLIAAHFRIFRSNQNVIAKAGIFSHTQVKFRFGGLRRGETERWEPGEEFVQALLRKIGGAFFAEDQWHARSADGWAMMPKGARASAKATKGRDLTPRAKVELACCESDEGRQSETYRMKYVDRGRMIETRGIVLHFTYTATLSEAVQAWENDGFGPHLVVDTDGKAYQLVDSLADQVAAAGGTNEWCVQLEIVGMGEKALLANAVQTAKVVAVVKELAAKFGIPLTNGDIEERRGVFSHGQAKKRWGRSRTLTGTDFDPGEAYMKRVLTEAGGRYVPEAEWKGRRDGTWVIEIEDWLP